jgi:plastocyanin
MATITLAVTVSNPGSGNKYYIDGVLQATVSMTPGNTYKFDQADSSNSGHPLRLSTTSNGSHNSGSEYTTGVTTSGTPGSAGAYTQIEVTALTVQTLYYYCTAHSGMGGTINVGNSSTKNLKEMSGFAVENLSADPVPYAQELSNNPLCRKLVIWWKYEYS